ncbi:MAG: 50S ribosomal protein L24 [Candidatus Eiseniibacteriota bacterium]
MGKKKKQPEPAHRTFRIKKGDTVVVLSGDSKGEPGKPRLGRVLAVDTKRWTVTVEKVNFIKRHTKPRGAGKESGILEKEAPLHISKVALWDPKAGKGVRVGIKRATTGKSRERISRATGETVGG